MKLMSKFIAIEGPEASGKTTICNKISENDSIDPPVVQTCEPGGGDLETTQSIKNLISDEELDFSRITEFILFVVDRTEHQKKYIDKIIDDYTVVTDRHALSSLVYQCLSHPQYSESDALDLFFNIHDELDITIPDLTIIVDVPYNIMKKRLKSRYNDLDKIESRGSDYHKNVRKNFLKVHEKGLYPNTKLVDGSGTIDECYNQVEDVLKFEGVI